MRYTVTNLFRERPQETQRPYSSAFSKKTSYADKRLELTKLGNWGAGFNVKGTKQRLQLLTKQVNPHKRKTHYKTQSSDYQDTIEPARSPLIISHKTVHVERPASTRQVRPTTGHQIKYDKCITI